MKVNTNAPSHPGLNIDTSNKAEKNKVAEAKEAKSSTSASASGSSVEISDKAKLLKTANEIVHQTPDVRSEKVQSLKKRIEAGTYQVDPGAIAERLLEDHLGTDFGQNNL